jgi:hypothetical protein
MPNDGCAVRRYRDSMSSDLSFQPPPALSAQHYLWLLTDGACSQQHLEKEVLRGCESIGCFWAISVVLQMKC